MEVSGRVRRQEHEVLPENRKLMAASAVDGIYELTNTILRLQEPYSFRKPHTQ